MTTASFERSTLDVTADPQASTVASTPEKLAVAKQTELSRSAESLSIVPHASYGDLPIDKVPLWNTSPEPVPRKELRTLPSRPPRRVSGGYRAELLRVRSASPRVFGSPRLRGSPIGRPLPWNSPVIGMRQPLTYRALKFETFPEREDGILSAHSVALKAQYEQSMTAVEEENRKRALHHSHKQEIAHLKSSLLMTARERFHEAERLFEEHLVYEKELERHVRMEKEEKERLEKQQEVENEREVRVKTHMEKTARIRGMVQEVQEREKVAREAAWAKQEAIIVAKKAKMQQQGKARLEAQRLRERIALQHRRERNLQEAEKRGPWAVKTRVVHERVEACEKQLAERAAATAKRQEQFVIDRERRRLVRDHVRELVRKKEEHLHAESLDAWQKRQDAREVSELAVELRHQRMVEESFLRSEVKHRSWEEQERRQRMLAPTTARLDVR